MISKKDYKIVDIWLPDKEESHSGKFIQRLDLNDWERGDEEVDDEVDDDEFSPNLYNKA